MSKNGSDKERTFTFYQKHAKDNFGKLLGYELENVKLEKQFGRSKVDFYAVDYYKKLEIYVENQLTNSDSIHHQKIVDLIDSISEGVIVWVALSFKDYHLQSIQEMLKLKRQKYINFYAVEITAELIEEVKLLDTHFKTHILSNIDMLDKLQEPMKIVYKVETIPRTFIGEAKIGKEIYDLTLPEDIRGYTLHELQKMIPYFPNIHYEKRPKKYDLSLDFGTGKSGLMYRCSVKNGKGKAFVELNFDKCEWKQFEMFKTHLSSMKLYIHPDIQVGNRKIGVYFNPYENLDGTIEKLGFILDRFIQYFSPYTYSKK